MLKKYNEQLKQRRNHRVEMEEESCVYVRMNSLIEVLVVIVDIQDEDEAMVTVSVVPIILGIAVSNVPQSSVAGHCLASGLVSASQLVVLQVTTPGIPDLPAATPHFVAHPVGSACIQLPNSVSVVKRPNIKMMGAHSNDRVSKHMLVDWRGVCDGCG